MIDEHSTELGKRESAVTFAAAIAAAFVAREALESGWRKTLDRDPPKNPAVPQVSWVEALTWGAASGALIGIARIASRRVTSTAWRKFR